MHYQFNIKFKGTTVYSHNMKRLYSNLITRKKTGFWLGVWLDRFNF